MPYKFFNCISITVVMSTEEKMHSITGDISDPDLGKENTEKTTPEERTEQSDPTTLQQIKEEHDLKVPQMSIDEDQPTLKSCKEQKEVEVEEIDISSVSKNENKGKVEDPSTSNPFQVQENPAKGQKNIHATSITPAENEEENNGTEKPYKVINEGVKCQEVEKPTTTEPSEDSKKQEDVPKPTTTSKKEAGDITETSDNITKKKHYRWFRFPKSSKEDKPEKNEGQAEAKQKDKPYDTQHVCGSYLLAIGVMFVCVAIVLGGFIWRIVYAIGGHHEDILNATACPTLIPPSNDSNATHLSVLKVLQKMWRNDSNDHVSD